MGLSECIVVLVAILGLWGSIWYRLGKLTSEVKAHNLKLTEISKTLERLITKGG